MVIDRLDSKSVDSHLDNHSNDGLFDTLISAPEGMFEGYDLTTEGDCLGRPVVAEVD